MASSKVAPVPPPTNEQEISLAVLKKFTPILLEDASSNNLDSVKQILRLDKKFPQFSIGLATDEEGRNALHRAALAGNNEIARLLIETYAGSQNNLKYIDIPDNYGNTPFFLMTLCLNKNDLIMSTLFMECNASINFQKQSDGMTALHWCCYHGNSELLQTLLEYHQQNQSHHPAVSTTIALPCVIDKDGRYPIDVCGMAYDKKWILEDGSKRHLSFKQKNVRSTLNDFRQCVVCLSNLECLQFYKPTLQYWNRVLFWSASIGDPTGVQLALKNKASPRWVHPLLHNKTSLHVAAQSGRNLKVVELLLEYYKNDPLPNTLWNMLDNENNNPLHCYVLGVTNKYHGNELKIQKKILTLFLNIGSNKNDSSASTTGSSSNENGNETETATESGTESGSRPRRGLSKSLTSVIVDKSGSSLDPDAKVILQNRIRLESSRNNQGFRPVDLIPALEPNNEEESAVAYHLRTKQSPYYKHILEDEPAVTFEWVLVFHNTPKIKGIDKQHEKIVHSLRRSHLLADIVPSGVDEVLVCVGCTNQWLYKHAEDLKYEVEILSSEDGCAEYIPCKCCWLLLRKKPFECRYTNGVSSLSSRCGQRRSFLFTVPLLGSDTNSVEKNEQRCVGCGDLFGVRSVEEHLPHARCIGSQSFACVVDPQNYVSKMCWLLLLLALLFATICVLERFIQRIQVQQF